MLRFVSTGKNLVLTRSMKAMLTLFNVNKRKTAITLIEILIAMSLLGIIGGLVARFFWTNSQYQKRLNVQTDCDNAIRNALWEMHKDLKASRAILYPRNNKVFKSDINNMVSDNKLVIRNFDGDIVTYYYQEETKELIRHKIYMPTENRPADEKKTIAKGFDNIVFTNRNEMNNLVGIYIEYGPSVLMDSVFLMND